MCLVYKIPYRRARAWPSARASKGILHTTVCHARFTILSKSRLTCVLLHIDMNGKKTETMFIGKDTS